jgi:hypothetical protein
VFYHPDNPGMRENWLKAIAADKLEWTQLSDLQDWKNAVAGLYGVRSIPQNYLIGPAKLSPVICVVMI